MIVARISDPYVCRAVLSAAHPEEEVVLHPDLASEATERGFPRLIVLEGQFATSAAPGRVPVLQLPPSLLRRWEVERWESELPPSRMAHLAIRLRGAMDALASEGTWVDRALADLTRAAGAQLPTSLRAFVRRALEFPTRYTDLHAVAESCGMTRGALKARFRRRGLPSPYTYLRWLRTMAVAEMLSDREVTIARAARLLGFTSDGNMCRMMGAATGMTPTELRTVRGWNRLLIAFAWEHLAPTSLAGWAELDDLFERRIA